MSIKPLIQLKREDFQIQHPILRKKTTEVADFGLPFQEMLKDLIDTFKSHEIAVGLAAPQLGFLLRVAVVNVRKGKPDPALILVNPKITEQSRQTEVKYESCMSLPHFRGHVERPIKIKISYQDETGKPHALQAEGFLARVICHEIDHLDGILYTDRVLDLSKLEPVDFFKEH